jgi:signal transduction histidine kinase
VEVRTAELRETSRRLAETLERAEELARAKSDFFSNVSHDLRTPLTLISGPLEELLAGREPPGGTAAAIESMHRNVGWLLRLINQLLDLARVDAGRVELRRTAVDLGSLARTVVESFVPAARARGVELSLQAPERTEPCALDPAWIESMLGNLISNALRYAEEGGWVRVRVEEEGEWFRIEVEDSGKGIAPEDLPSVFERFVQGRGSDRRKGGAGIGLALVREAARLHGGDAEVRSDPGKGALFTVTLPVVKMGEDAVEQEAAGQKAAATESGRAGRRSRVRLFSSAGDELLSDPSQIDVDADRPGPSPEAPLVLVVEDHADTRRFVADVLSESYRVKGAADGEEGLRLALEINPDAVVTDIDMPKMNGMELCRALRGREETSSIPIILLTALRGTGQVLGGFEAGADDFVEKPFHGRELLARVDAHIRLRQAISQIAHNSRLAMLGQTAASVAHQIRNPLNVVYSGLQSLHGRIERTSDPRTAQMLGVMLDSAARINQITDDLMNVSRLNRASRERFRVADGLTSCSRLIRARLPRGVTLEEAIDEGAMLEGRPSDLNQVFLNLLDNALRAVGEQGRIELRSLQRDGHVYVSVADSGPGVEESDRERIFKPFFTTRRAGEGTGLGLSIAWQVVNQHGGDISVGRSELGGALFTVRIPIANGAS